MPITGHRTRSIFDRYHIDSSTDRVEAVRWLAALRGAIAMEPRKVLAIGEASARRRGTARGRSRHTEGQIHPQLPAKQWRTLASPSIENSNHLIHWLREMAELGMSMAE